MLRMLDEDGVDVLLKAGERKLEHFWDGTGGGHFNDEASESVLLQGTVRVARESRVSGWVVGEGKGGMEEAGEQVGALVRGRVVLESELCEVDDVGVGAKGLEKGEYVRVIVWEAGREEGGGERGKKIGGGESIVEMGIWPRWL